MKRFATQNILVEMSQRDLEMVEISLAYTASYFQKQASMCQPRAEGAKASYTDLAERYNKLCDQVREIQQSMPF